VLRDEIFRMPSTLATMITTLVGVPLAAGVTDEDDPSSAAMFLFRKEIAGETWWGHEGYWGTAAYTCPAHDVTIVAGNQRSDMPEDFVRTAIISDAFAMLREA